MRLKNVVIVVKDLERSKAFYKELFGLEVILEREGNVMLTEGLVLQDEDIWRETVRKDIIPQSHAMELYFEERDLEGFGQRLWEYEKREAMKGRLWRAEECCQPCDKRIIRMYDPDGHLIEVGQPG